jgi:sugar lactone lactonase YvrE
MGIPSPGDAPGSTLKSFDLATGELKSSAPLPGDHPFCNDIAIAPDGRVYAADTLASRVLRLSPDGTRLEVWATDPQLTPAPNSGGVDGVVFGKDGALYLTTFNKGELFRIKVAPDGAAGEVTKLNPSRALTLPDTLRLLEDGSFLLVEGGGTLDRVTVSGNEAQIDTLAGGLNGPVSMALVGDTVWVAEGQLGILLDPARKGQKPKLPFQIVPVPIQGR